MLTFVKIFIAYKCPLRMPVEYVNYVVSLAGSTPLLAPITGAIVSGKQSQGDSNDVTSPVSETEYGYGRRWTSELTGDSSVYSCQNWDVTVLT